MTTEEVRTTTDKDKPLRTLIVDDEADIRELVAATIRAANRGLRVGALAASGEEAIDLCRDQEFECILLDQRMPGLSGLETASRILAEQPEQVIILFSAYLDEDIRRQADELGICECMEKGDVREIPEALWRCGPP